MLRPGLVNRCRADPFSVALITRTKIAIGMLAQGISWLPQERANARRRAEIVGCAAIGDANPGTGGGRKSELGGGVLGTAPPDRSRRMPLRAMRATCYDCEPGYHLKEPADERQVCAHWRLSRALPRAPGEPAALPRARHGAVD